MTNPDPHRPDSATRILISTIAIIVILAWACFPWATFAQPFPAVTR